MAGVVEPDEPEPRPGIDEPRWSAVGLGVAVAAGRGSRSRVAPPCARGRGAAGRVSGLRSACSRRLAAGGRAVGGRRRRAVAARRRRRAAVLGARTIGRLARWCGGGSAPEVTIDGPATAAVLVASTATAPALAANALAPVPAISSAIRSARRRPGAAGARGRRPLRRAAAARPPSPPRAASAARGARAGAPRPRTRPARARPPPASGPRRDPQQRLALALRQRGEAGQRLADDRAALHLLLGRRPPRSESSSSA